ncbi:peroxiredoxin [Eikenella sp. Marseille-P7795]|uniref:peroxiredoxin family protein n=1 Tax=Eikenella sp. Marseille-P7795 TaxID=2866577 RepID=UPI001CE42FAC|nr:TlpA disulfide reductase family protein [Eikenella sp. Marseille-P7795]
MKKWLGTFLFAVVLAAAGYILLSPQHQPAPAFALPNLQGQTVNQSALQGKVTLINFWFPSCPGCVTEMPKLIQMAHDYQGKNFQIIAVSIPVPSDPLPVVKAYAEQHRLPFTVLYDEQGHTQQAYQVIAAPTSFLVNSKGQVVKTFVGEPDFAEVYRLTDSLLAE